MQPLNETEKFMLNRLSDHFGKTPFSLEECRTYMMESELFTKEDFDKCWQKFFTLDNKSGEPNGYIARSGRDNYKLLYKALQYKSKDVEKEKWSHGEIIGIVSSIISGIIALAGIIFPLIFK